MQLLGEKEATQEERRILEHFGMADRSGIYNRADPNFFHPGVDDEFHYCPRCGEVQTMGGRTCSSCQAEKAKP